MATFDRSRNQKGFTLIEIIAVLLLVGILAGIFGFGITAGIRGYLLAQENSAMSQKAQLAMKRLTREFIECFDCVGTGTVSLDFTYENHLEDRTLSMDGGALKLNGYVLVDQVSDFSMKYEDDGRLTFTLEMSHKQGRTTKEFTASVLPRNL